MSGSAQGYVTLFENLGGARRADFAKGTPLVRISETAFTPDGPDDLVFGDAHIRGPQASTRVFAADVNGDGKLDLLVGDSVRLSHPAEGLNEEDCRAAHLAWPKQYQALSANAPPFDQQDPEAISAEQAAAREIFQRRLSGGKVSPPTQLDRELGVFLPLASVAPREEAVRSSPTSRQGRRRNRDPSSSRPQVSTIRPLPGGCLVALCTEEPAKQRVAPFRETLWASPEGAGQPLHCSPPPTPNGAKLHGDRSAPISALVYRIALDVSVSVVACRASSAASALLVQ